MITFLNRGAQIETRLSGLAERKKSLRLTFIGALLTKPLKRLR
jgi:hypothetical protein